MEGLLERVGFRLGLKRWAGPSPLTWGKLVQVEGAVRRPGGYRAGRPEVREGHRTQEMDTETGQVFGFYSGFPGEPLGTSRQENGAITLVFLSTVTLVVGSGSREPMGKE